MKIVQIIMLLLVVSNQLFSVELSEYRKNKKAENAYKSENYEEALKQTTLLLEESPENGRYFHNLGESSMRLKRPNDAAKYFSQASQLLPRDEKIDSMVGLGAAYLMSNKLDQSVAINKEILKLDPTNGFAKHNLELALIAKQQEEEQKSQALDNKDEESSDNDQDQDSGEMNPNEQDYDQDNNPDEQETPPSDEELENEKQEAMDKARKERESSQEDARSVLNRLLQDEEESRRKHFKKPFSELGVENDW